MLYSFIFVYHISKILYKIIIRAVSYTHLDVYKRQVLDGEDDIHPVFFIQPAVLCRQAHAVEEQTVEPVSYTHLDALTAAFTEYSGKKAKNREKPSIIKMLRALRAPEIAKDVTKVRNKDKGLEI